MQPWIFLKCIKKKTSFLFTDMARIKVRHGESLEQALRRFNREVHRAGILKEVKRRERFEKPSAIKKRKKKEKARKIWLENRRKWS